MKLFNILYGPLGILLLVLVGMGVALHVFPHDSVWRLLGLVPGLSLMVVAILRSQARRK